MSQFSMAAGVTLNRQIKHWHQSFSDVRAKHFVLHDLNRAGLNRKNLRAGSHKTLPFIYQEHITYICCVSHSKIHFKLLRLKERKHKARRHIFVNLHELVSLTQQVDRRALTVVLSKSLELKSLPLLLAKEVAMAAFVGGSHLDFWNLD